MKLILTVLALFWVIPSFSAEMVVYTGRTPYPYGSGLDRDIILMNLKTGEKRNLTADKTQNWTDDQAALSLNGKEVVFITDRFGDGGYQLALMDIRSAEIQQIYINIDIGGNPNGCSHQQYMAASPSFSPEGEVIYFTRAKGSCVGKAMSTYQLMSYEIATGVLRKLTDGPKSFHFPQVSPDGQLIAFTHPGGGTKRPEDSSNLRVFELATGEVTVLDKSRPIGQGARRPVWRGSEELFFLAQYGDGGDFYTPTVFKVPLYKDTAHQIFRFKDLYDYDSVCWFDKKRGVFSARHRENSTYNIYSVEDIAGKLKISRLTSETLPGVTNVHCRDVQ